MRLLVLPLFVLMSFACVSLARAEGDSVEKVAPVDQAQVALSFAPLVKKVAPAVVNIYTKRTTVSRTASNPFMDDPFFQQFLGNGLSLPMDNSGSGLTRKQVEGALGSGVIVDSAGVVVTNVHVIKGADQISVVLADGREFDAHVSLMDEPSDLAVLRIDPRNAVLPAVTLKPSETMEVGDLVLAIGNPFGVGQTVTSGIVSALARSSMNVSNFNFFIQTDAAVNPGNSGGPLVAMDGAVVGINTAIYSRSGGSLGIGFAVPSEMVETVIAAEAGGKGRSATGGMIRPWLGVTSQSVTSDMAESLGLKTPSGTLISRMHPASPLAKAGVKIGDVIVTMNGKPIHDAAEMKFRMATVPLGSTADIGVFRNGKTFEAQVLAAAAPDDPPRNETSLSAGLFNGASVANINPAIVSEIPNLSQTSEGVVVTGVDPRSTAARFLKVGDVVLRVNGFDIKAVQDLKRALTRKSAAFDLMLDRGGQKQQIVVR